MVAGNLTIEEQKNCGEYIHKGVKVSGSKKNKIFGYTPDKVSQLLTWISNTIEDGKTDVLVIIDICPAAVFQGEADSSLAEQWMKKGNMIIWTGSEPFSSYVDTAGVKADADAGAEGASKILDVSTPGLCRGGGMQDPTTAVRDYANPGAPVFDGQYNNGDYDISAFAPYQAQYALKYDQLLIDAISSDLHHMSYWRAEEVFAENSEKYQSDNIVLANQDGGEFGQFYCLPGLNDTRKQVITQVINNWVALPCRSLVVTKAVPTPAGQFSTIQAALNAAIARDTVLVREGFYNEQLLIPIRGIKLVSDSSNGGNDLLTYDNFEDSERGTHRRSRAEEYGMESKKILRRAQRTVIDGAGYAPGYPMVEFPKGSTIGTLVDGFTVQKMPAVNHQTPGHSHVVQTRGGSGTILNNIVRNNGSSGLGSHAQVWGEEPGVDHATLDFRYTNIKYDAHPILVNNVVHNNEGNNLGNNHYSYAIMHNNECFESISEHGHESPGIGCQHGAHPLIVKNLVYKSSWIGIGSRKGPQAGVYPINRPSHPVMRGNWVFDCGVKDSSGTDDSEHWEDQYGLVLYPYPGEHGAGIGADDTGGYDPKTGEIKYHIIDGNYVNGAKDAGIGCRSSNPAYHDLPADVQPGEYPDDLGFVKITNNTVTRAGMVVGEFPNVGFEKAAGIGINGAHAVEITGNKLYGNKDAGIGIRGSGVCDLIAGNECYENSAAGIGLREGASATEITGNNLHNNTKAGIGHDGTDGRVTVGTESYNAICHNGEAGIGSMSSDIGLITYNECDENGMAGIGLQMGATVDEISHNYLHNNAKAGIGHDGTEGRVTVGTESYNVICHNGEAGIGNMSSDIGLIAHNECYENSRAGIGLQMGATVDEITANHLYNNAMAGIGLDGTEGRVRVRLESDNDVIGNRMAGIGMQAADVTEIRGNLIQNNGHPGITVVEGTIAGLITDNTLDHNGLGCGTPGLVVLADSSATIKNTSISYSGKPGITVAGEGASAVLENCRFEYSGQCGQGPNLVVNDRANATVTGCVLNQSNGSPNIEASGAGTALTMSGCTVTASAKPGLVASAGATLDIRDTVFDGNGTDGTVGMMLNDCPVYFEGLTICNSTHWAVSATNCSGAIKGCELYLNGLWGGGHMSINGCRLDIVRNTVHDPAYPIYQIAILNGSACNVYHNTIVGNADGGIGPANQGPGDGLHIDYNSSADVRNNIFYRLPRGVAVEAGGVVTGSNNCFSAMTDFDEGETGIIGDNPILSNPFLTDDYKLTCYSECIDAAERITGINDEYNGDGPDAGANESPGLPCIGLEWATPTRHMEGCVPAPELLIDNDLATGNPWAPGPFQWAVFEIANGDRVAVYGIRLYAGSFATTWQAFVGDDLGGPWYPITSYAGPGDIGGYYGWYVGDEGAGWDQFSPFFLRSARYIKLFRANSGWMTANGVFEFNVLLSGETVPLEP